MRLRYIERGARLSISAMSEQEDGGEVYEALFYDMHDLLNESSIVVQCASLNKDFNKLGRFAMLDISFTVGPNVFAFIGRAVEKMYSDMVVIEQASEIETLNRRKYERDEFRVEVRIFGLPEEYLSYSRYTMPGTRPVLTEMSFDVSAGGMCIVTNTNLISEFDPYYLVSFTIGERDSFLLPAKLVRRSNFARSRVGKYDYGFQFIYDNMPDEMARLTKAILNKKILSL